MVGGKPLSCPSPWCEGGLLGGEIHHLAPVLFRGILQRQKTKVLWRPGSKKSHHSSSAGGCRLMSGKGSSSGRRPRLGDSSSASTAWSGRRLQGMAWLESPRSCSTASVERTSCLNGWLPPSWPSAITQVRWANSSMFRDRTAALEERGCLHTEGFINTS